MADEQQRKATDVLLSIEEKVNTLLQSMSVYNMNTKLILDRVNKVHNYISMLEAEAASLNAQEQPTDPNNETVKTSVENVITIAAVSDVPRRTVRAETYAPMQPSAAWQKEPENVEQPDRNVIQHPPQTVAPKPAGPEKKVPVSQRITDSTGKDLFMAAVNILNENKELITQTKTNATGKWQAHLKPGKYHVHVVKTDTATKVKIEATQEVMVPNSDTVVILPTAIIKR